MTKLLRLASNLDTRNQSHIVSRSLLLRSLISYVEVGLNTILIGTGLVDPPVLRLLRSATVVALQEIEILLLALAALEMLGHRDNIQTIIPRFGHAAVGRNVTIRVNRVNMQIGLVDVISVHLGQKYLAARRRIVLQVDLFRVGRLSRHYAQHSNCR